MTTAQYQAMYDVLAGHDLVAENLILLGYWGSHLRGTQTEESDLDLVGVMIEPPEIALGVGPKFEQYVFRGNETRKDGQSSPSDVEGTIYALRKYVNMAARSNPSILVSIFMPEDKLFVQNEIGKSLQDNRDMFVTRDMAGRFIGYMTSNTMRLSKESPGRMTRPELVDKYGFDTKRAMKTIELGLQGVELLETGKLVFPFEQDRIDLLHDIRFGRWTHIDCIDYAKQLVDDLETLRIKADLPETPDLEKISKWQVKAHLDHWKISNGRDEDLQTRMQALLSAGSE